MLALLLLLLASPVHAQGWGSIWPDVSTTPGATGGQPCPDGNQGTWQDMEPTEVDARALEFEGRTLSAAGLLRVEAIFGTDNDPNSIVTASTVSGKLLTFVIEPTGREGNWYQVCGRPTDSNGRKPWGCACLQIKRTRYSAPSR